MLVLARYEIESVFFYCDLYRKRLLPTEQDLERIGLAHERIDNVIKFLGGDGCDRNSS